MFDTLDSNHDGQLSREEFEHMMKMKQATGAQMQPMPQPQVQMPQMPQGKAAMQPGMPPVVQPMSQPQAQLQQMPGVNVIPPQMQMQMQMQQRTAPQIQQQMTQSHALGQQVPAPAVQPQVEQVFDNLDSNHDGRLSREEFAHMMKMKQATGAQMQPMPQPQVQMPQMPQGKAATQPGMPPVVQPIPKPQAQLQQRPGVNVIAPQMQMQMQQRTAPQIQQQMTQSHAPGQQVPAPAVQPQVEQVFDTLDSNHDGRLSREEFAHMMKMKPATGAQMQPMPQPQVQMPQMPQGKAAMQPGMPPVVQPMPQPQAQLQQMPGVNVIPPQMQMQMQMQQRTAPQIQQQMTQSHALGQQVPAPAVKPQVEQVFDNLDSNHDGRLSREEFAHMMKMKQATGAQMQPMPQPHVQMPQMPQGKAAMQPGMPPVVQPMPQPQAQLQQMPGVNVIPPQMQMQMQQRTAPQIQQQMTQSHAPGQQVPAPAIQPQVEQVFDTLDSNHDGQLSREEFEHMMKMKQATGAQMQPMPQPQVQMPQMPQGKAAMQPGTQPVVQQSAVPQNYFPGNAPVSQQMPCGRSLSANDVFDLLDQDHDGRLTPEEFQHFLCMKEMGMFAPSADEMWRTHQAQALQLNELQRQMRELRLGASFCPRWRGF